VDEQKERGLEGGGKDTSMGTKVDYVFIKMNFII
jgi:hypothetical protein